MHMIIRNIVAPFAIAGLFVATAGLWCQAYAQDTAVEEPWQSEMTELAKAIAEYQSQGRYADAIPAAERVVEIVEQNLSSEDPAVAQELNMLAVLHYRSGAFAKALPLHERVLAIREKAQGKEHPQVAQTLNSLAELYTAQGKYEQALPLHEHALAIREKALGNTHPDVGSSLNNLAELYRARGKYELALPLYQRALAIRENALGNGHPDVAETLNNLALLYDAQGKYELALPLYQRALAITEQALGKEHPSVATSLNNLALLYDAQGKYEQALPLYQRALAIRENVLGNAHPDVAQTLNNLAIVYKAQGKYEEALPLYQRALAINENALGKYHSSVAISMNNLALLYDVQGKYEEALPLYQRALAINENALGREHPHVAIFLNNLAELHRAQGKYEEALPLYQRALAINENALGKYHPSVAITLDNLARLYKTQGKYEEALSLYQRALAVNENTLGNAHPSVATTLNNLAALYRAQGKYEQALQLYQRSLVISEKALGTAHPDVASTLNNLALLYDTQGKYEQALPLHQRALSIREKALGNSHPHVAIALNNLAGSYGAQGKYEQALSLHQRALSIREKALGNAHPHVAQTLNNLAELYGAQGKYEQALPLHQRALAIRENALGREHPDVAIVLNNLAGLYWAQGKLARAVDFFRRADAAQEQNIRVGILAASEQDKRLFMTTMIDELHVYVAFALQTAHADAYRLAAARLFRHKGRVLDDMTVSLAALRQQASPESASLLAEYLSVRSQYATLLQRGPGKVPAVQHRANLQSLRDRLGTIEREIAQGSKKFRLQRQPVTVEAVQKALGRRTALVEWVRYEPFDPKARMPEQRFGSPRYAAMVLRPEGGPQWLDLGDAAEIDALVYQLRNRMQRAHAESYSLAKQLHARILAPLMAGIGDAGHLYLAPDAMLSQISFAALMDQDGRYLIETHDLSYLTSGRDLLRMAESAEPKSSALIVADPEYGQPRPGQLAFQPIPKAAEEANSVQSFLPGAQILRGTEAREKRIIDMAAPEVLHLATHGQFLYADCGLEDQDQHRCNDAMLKSSLAFAGANGGRDADGNDGLLTAYEVMGMNLFGTKLVVLSACDTGLGDANVTTSAGRSIGEADGLYGLRRAFVVAGAESQMVTLWKIDAYTTLDILTEYYRLLKQGMGRSEALRYIQLDMIRQGRHPYRWAGFILSGNPAAMDGSRMPGTASTSSLPRPGRSPRGCGCHAASVGNAGDLGILLLVAVWLAYSRRSRRRSAKRQAAH